MLLRTTFKYSIRIEVAVPPKLWLKWKGRKLDGWRSTRTYREPSRDNRNEAWGCTTFTCTDITKVGLMTPEKLDEITTMLQLLRNTAS